MSRRILAPALITLGVTILRLAGELQGWSPGLFSREAGGGRALVGIAWLPFVFGAVFAWQLIRDGEGPARAARSLLTYVLALAAFFATAFLLTRIAGEAPVAQLLATTVAAVVALVVASRTWPGLFKTLLAYAYAARIPVVIVMLLAIYGSWGTHYDALPPGPGAEPVAAMGPLTRWFWIGVIPQLGFWIAYTVVVGGIIGCLTALVIGRKRAPAYA